MFDWKILHSHVTGSLNSEQLVFGPEWKSKIVIMISDEAEKFGCIQNFWLMKKIGYVTFYGGHQYINPVKGWSSIEKICIILSLAT